MGLLLALLIACSETMVPSAPQGPTSVVLFIGDGMGPAQVHAARLTAGKPLNLDRLTVLGSVDTRAADRLVTDSAASATALASGVLGNYGEVALDPQTGAPLATLVDIAHDRGLATGIVVTSEIEHATPAAFLGHTTNRYDYLALAADTVQAPVDVLVGGGLAYMRDRPDGRDLTAEWPGHFVTDLDALSRVTAPPVLALMADKKLPPVDARGKDWLARTSLQALRLLEQDPEGYFLMIEGSLIDTAAHNNDGPRMVAETLDLDRAIGAVLDHVGPNVLVVVTADHETGAVELYALENDPDRLEIKFHSTEHSAIPVGVWARGPGSEGFAGHLEQVDLFTRIRAAWPPSETALDNNLARP